ncbi:Cell division protein DedD [Arsenophonus endosymbiont of Bemisia tabaci Q2]|nr:Cell division protein DedD [Arsenophonus endosymbiont of Bemisia tabaci Q2]
MASKFQNRLVGTILIVAVGVIVLPILLDGNKKYNETEFAAIPLVPKASDEYEIEPIAPINPKPLQTSSASAAEAMISEATSDSKAKSADSLSAQQQGKFKPAVKVEKPVLVPKHITKSNEKTQVPQARAYVIQFGSTEKCSKSGRNYC